MEDYISKRELLEATGISYGQLYRWKREKLIPDSWFIKRSAFTGQETFLPRKAIERIEFILKNKDRYSLTQLLMFLSPGATSGSYPVEKVASLPFALKPAAAVAKLTGAEVLDHGQALCVMIGADMLKSGISIAGQALTEVLSAILLWQKQDSLLERDDGRIVLLQNGDAFMPLFIRPEGEIRPPEGVRIAYFVSLSDLPEKCGRLLTGLLEGETTHE